MAEATVRVSVVYATPARQFRRQLELPAGATVGEAVEHSAIAVEAGLARDDLQQLGVFGHIVDAKTVLRDGDRVEIYRPLNIDPKEARRRRAMK
jgi:putative ubiquitin-RnfH superfamily antitoxin RatB of RatAB toxin-antitoxin module